MRSIRLEESFDEAVLPAHIVPDTDFSKIDAALASPKLKAARKHNTPGKSLEKDYREDIKD